MNEDSNENKNSHHFRHAVCADGAYLFRRVWHNLPRLEDLSLNYRIIVLGLFLKDYPVLELEGNMGLVDMDLLIKLVHTSSIHNMTMLRVSGEELLLW